MPWNDNSGGGGPWGSGGGGNNNNPWGNGPRRPGGGGQGGGGNEPDLEELIRRFQRWLNGMGGKGGSGGGSGKGGKGGGGLIGLLVLVAAVGWLVWPGNFYYIVGADQAGVVLRFGEYARTTGSGPHVKLPYPVETVLLPEVTTTNSVQVGATDAESLMITRDENIVDVDFVVQWRVDLSYAEGVRAANEGRSDFDREAIVRKLKTLREEAVDLLNAKADDEYLFAGNRTAEKPFHERRVGLVRGKFIDVPLEDLEDRLFF